MEQGPAVHAHGIAVVGELRALPRPMAHHLLEPGRAAGVIVRLKGGNGAAAGQMSLVQAEPGHQQPARAQDLGQARNRALQSAFGKQGDDVACRNTEVKPPGMP